MSKLDNELKGFQNIWKGGFFTGYNNKRNQKGIEQYLRANMSGNICLEIGCGGGQWSKFIYNLNIFDRIYCIDALSEEHNKFWNYVGHDKKDKIEYIQVTNFSLDCIPNNILDYVFSYDVFCHISYSGQKEYIKNLSKKCRSNCKLLIMYADPEKYLKSEPENKWFIETYLPGGHSTICNICKKSLKMCARTKNGNEKQYSSEGELIKTALNNCDGNPSNGRWYWIGINNFINLCNM